MAGRACFCPPCRWRISSTQKLYEEMKAQLSNKGVDVEEAMVLCCKKKDARLWFVRRLRKLKGGDFRSHGVDGHGKDRHVKTIAHGDDVVNGTEEKSAKTYYTDKKTTRSAFSSMPASPVVRLKKGAKVLATQNKDVRVGCMGLVVGFGDAALHMQDAVLIPWESIEIKEHYV